MASGVYHDWLQQQELLKYAKPDHIRSDYNCYHTNGIVMDEAMMSNYFNLKNMKFRNSDIIVSSFPKSGKVGDWKNYFNDQLENDFDKWFQEHFGNSDIQFEYHI